MQKCSFPGCSHIGDAITNLHTTTAHGLSKTETIEKYGKFDIQFPVMNRSVQNWLEYHPVISSKSFNDIYTKRLV